MLKEFVAWQDRVEANAKQDVIEGHPVKGLLKCFGSGAAEGAILGLAFAGAYCAILGAIASKLK